MSLMMITRQSNISSKEPRKTKWNIRLSMPAAPVTNTFTGSFSIFTKLHMYLISVQKKAMINKTARPF